MRKPDDLERIDVLARIAATRSVIDHARTDLDQMMLEAYSLGVTGDAIATAAGIGRATLYRYLDAQDINRHRTKRSDQTR